MSDKRRIYLAPLRGVTIRAFRDAFAKPLHEADFIGAFAPFIPANPGIKPNSAMLKEITPVSNGDEWELVPQVISRHSDSMRVLLKAFKDVGFKSADLNAGCPFPMIQRRGRGSGLMKTPDILEEMIAAGCEEMGEGNFSVKVRLGISDCDELLKLLPIFNRYRLRVLTIHARTAKQMYEGGVNLDAFENIVAESKNPIMYNGDITLDESEISSPTHITNLEKRFPSISQWMVGRSFITKLALRSDARQLLENYINISCEELSGDNPVLGRMKELLSYWATTPKWKRLWSMIKICRSVDELRSVVLR
jgi:tRNA-dihydrouridine synthase